MRIRRFFIGVALVLAVLAAFNGLLAWKTDSVANLVLRQMRAQSKIDVLFVGNSLMQADVDTKAMAAAWPAGDAVPDLFNGGLGASYPVEHYLMAKQGFAHHDGVRLLIYGFFDQQMTDFTPGGWEDLAGNRAMSYSVDPATAAALYAPGSAWQKWRFQFIGAVPFLADHSQVWKFVEIFRRKLADFGMPKVDTNEFGRAQDFDLIAFPPVPVFIDRSRTAMEKPDALIPAISALLDLAKANKARLMIVEMPVTSTHRERYYSTDTWHDYRAYLQHLLEARGVTYVNASEFIDDSCYQDALHLNQKGAEVFSTKMAPVIANALKQP